MPIDLSAFDRLIEENRSHVKAVGEIGLDGKYSQDDDKKKRQHEVFLSLLALAERYTLPVVIHSRLAIDDVFAAIPSFKLSRILLHWYSGPLEYLNRIRDQGYLISVGPSILYSKRSADIALKADLSTILTETDGPVSYYGPFKGKPTRPAFVIDVVRKLAELKNRREDEVRDAIWNNFLSFIAAAG
jgi:TatD DNase family protein